MYHFKMITIWLGEIMFNNSDHELNTSLTVEQIRAVLVKIESDLEDAMEHLNSGGSGWYSLDRLFSIAEVSDMALRGEVSRAIEVDNTRA